MGSGGYVVYYGPSSRAASLLADSPIINATMLTTDNPGDFIIDVLGLGNDEGELALTEESSDHSSSQSTSDSGATELPQGGDSTEATSPRPLPQELNRSRLNSEEENDKHLRTIKLHKYFVSTSAYSELMTDLAPIIGTNEDSQQFNDENGIEMSDLSSHSSHGLITPRQNRKRTVQLPSVFGWDSINLKQSTKIQERFRYPATTLTQIWVLFCRRTQVILSAVV